MAASSRLIRWVRSSLSATWVSWLTALVSSSQSCHSLSPSTRMGAFSEASGPDRRRFIETTSSFWTPSLVAMVSTWSGCRSPSWKAEMALLALRRLKNSFFCEAVVPILTRLHDLRMYSWIEARIHHMA